MHHACYTIYQSSKYCQVTEHEYIPVKFDTAIGLLKAHLLCFSEIRLPFS